MPSWPWLVAADGAVLLMLGALVLWELWALGGRVNRLDTCLDEVVLPDVAEMDQDLEYQMAQIIGLRTDIDRLEAAVAAVPRPQPPVMPEFLHPVAVGAPVRDPVDVEDTTLSIDAARDLGDGADPPLFYSARHAYRARRRGRATEATG